MFSFTIVVTLGLQKEGGEMTTIYKVKQIEPQVSNQDNGHFCKRKCAVQKKKKCCESLSPKSADCDWCRGYCSHGKRKPLNHKRVLKRHLERATAISMIDQDRKTGAQSLTC